MGLFNRRRGRVAGPAEDTSSLTGSGINTDKTFGKANKDVHSSTPPDVNKTAKGGVSFSDTVLTDRGSFKAGQQEKNQAGPPAGPVDEGEGDSTLKHVTDTAQRIAGTVLPVGAGEQPQTDSKQQQQPSAGEAAKGEGTEKGIFLNEEELLSHSTFPIPPERLVEMAKDVLRAGVHKCGKLSDDFTFSAPFIGPLNKEDFAKTMETLSLDSVFPDLAPRIYHIRVDPLQPNRVWFTTRPIGTNTGYLTAKLPIPVSPTGKVVELPPQTSSLSFNDRGEVRGGLLQTILHVVLLTDCFDWLYVTRCRPMACSQSKQLVKQTPYSRFVRRLRLCLVAGKPNIC